MARNSKNKKIARKNKKLRYRKGGPARLDMRKGGRVSLAGGGSKIKEIEEETTAKKEKSGDKDKKKGRWYPGK